MTVARNTLLSKDCSVKSRQQVCKLGNFFFQDRLDMVEDYCEKSKQNPVPRQYGILCWDERSEENLLLGTWRLHSPPLERNRATQTQKEHMTQSIEATLLELEHGAVPSCIVE